MANPMSFMKKTPTPYLDPSTGRPPEDLFLPYEALQSDHMKKYMDEEARVKMLRGYVELAVKEKMKEMKDGRSKKVKGK